MRSPQKIDSKDLTQLIQREKNNSYSDKLAGATAPPSSENDSATEDMAKTRIITINLNDFNQGVNLNFELQNNDTLYIPKAKFFYVVGEVKSPGRFKLEKEVNVLQTISIAGGLTQKANEKKIKIIRTIEGKDQEIKAEMTDLVLPDDIIKVPESFF